MRAVGDKQTRTIRPDFDRPISIDFQGAKITSDTGFLVLREIDQRFNILGGAASQIDDPRSPRHADHSLLELLRQRVYQVAAGYEDCNDADHLRVDPALRLALGKEHENGAGQSALSRFENSILATRQGLEALESAISRSADTMRGYGTSMLHWLFPSHATIESYSLEPATWCDGDKLTNCGRRCVGKSKKSVSRTFELRFVFGKLYVIGGSEVQRSFSSKNSIPTFNLDAERRS